MLRVRWSKRTQADVRRIADYWLEHDPEVLPVAIRAIYQRVNWLADGHQHVGPPVTGLPQNYRVYRERRYGYKIYYWIEGTPTDQLAVLTIRHGRALRRDNPPTGSGARRAPAPGLPDPDQAVRL